MEFILIRGGSQKIVTYAQQAGWYYGIRSDYLAYTRAHMVDYNWKKDTDKTWAQLVALVKEHRPKQVVVLDLEHPNQVAQLRDRLHEIASLGSTPVVVPKYSGAVAHIPLDVHANGNTFSVVLGVSVPSQYAGYLPLRAEVAGWQLHLLGGHVDQWTYLMRYYDNATVVSADGNVIVYKAHMGAFWRKTGWGYRETRKLRKFSTDALAVYSLRNAKRYVLSGHVNDNCKRVRDCKAVLACEGEAHV